MTYQLGVDLGTTYTAAAIRRSGSRGFADAEVVSLGSRSAPVASVLYLGADATVLVGDAAERRALTDPGQVVREFKRRIGDDTPLIVGGREYAAHQLCARMVRWVCDQVAERQGGPARTIVVTHPASWGSYKTGLLGNALADLGLAVTFLPEPLAAAISYAGAERVETGSTIAVYDLGGGTFDVALVRKTGAGGGFELLGRPQGIERLGGVDFDEAVFSHVRAGIGKAMDELDAADPNVLAAVARLRRDCVEAKEALSSDTEAVISVLLPEVRTQIRLVRSELETMIRPALDQTVSALRDALGSAGLTAADLSAVLLVGGSSRIPLVSQLVSQELGRPVAVDADPKSVIAVGAALAGAPPGHPAKPPSVASAAAKMAAVKTPVKTPAQQRVTKPPVVTGPPRKTPADGGPRPTSQKPPAQNTPGQKARAALAPSARAVGSPQPARPRSPARPARAAAPRTSARPSSKSRPSDGSRPASKPLRRRAGPLIALGGVIGIVAIVGVVLLWPEAGLQSAGQSDRVPISQINPTCKKPPATDAAKAVVSYDAKLMVDGEPSTAWACDGDGKGVEITLDFGKPVAVSSIQMIPGYAKTDPTDGTDRYRQNRRLSEVQYTLDGGQSFTQQLDTSADNRRAQTEDLNGLVARRIVLKIVSSVPGEDTNGQGATDTVAISELAVTGTPQ